MSEETDKDCFWCGEPLNTEGICTGCANNQKFSTNG